MNNRRQVIEEVKTKNYQQQKENRLRKFKQLVSKVKEKTKEKFQTFIVKKNN